MVLCKALYFVFQVGPDSVHLKLEEKHSVELSNLQSSMVLSFKEELRQVRNRIRQYLMPLFSQNRTINSVIYYQKYLH